MKVNYKKSSINSYKTPEGETIEKKVKRIEVDNEPISDGAPIIYTEKKDGVRPEYNVRTDRFEVAATAMDIVHKNKTAKSGNGTPENKNNSDSANTNITGDQKPNSGESNSGE